MSNNSEHNSLWKLFSKVSDRKLIQFLLGYCPFNICFTCMLGDKYTFFHTWYIWSESLLLYSDNIYLSYIIHIYFLTSYKHIMCICVFVCFCQCACIHTSDFQYLTLLRCFDGRIVCVLIKLNVSFSNFYGFFSIYSLMNHCLGCENTQGLSWWRYMSVSRDSFLEGIFC